jgi:aspartyl-tRNA(Asn)/glutamyl-tRNA(Gln) amidotransferase subunit A
VHFALAKKVRVLAVKDNIATSSLPTTCGSGILRDYQSPFGATVTEKLRKAGALINGKTNLDEFGMGSHSTHSYFGPVRGDSFDQLSVGGSSGGSAVAVAAGQCDVALGTDTGGSVRLPAAYTGIVGFKPSYGVVSRWGVVPYANSLDTVGILAHTTKEILQVLEQAQGHDSRDPTSITNATLQRMKEGRMRAAIQTGRHGPIRENFEKLKIGIPMEYNIEELDPGVRQAWTNALEIFQGVGCTVVPVSLASTRHALSAYYILAPAEAASNLSKYDGVRYGARNNSRDLDSDVLYSQTRGEGFGDEVRRRILLGSYTLSSKAIDNYFIKAQKVRRLVQRDFDRIFSLPNPLRPLEQFDLSEMDESITLRNKLGPSQVDFVVCPTAPTLPPTLEDISRQAPVDAYMNDVFTVPASLAGLPAVSVPFRIPDNYQKPDVPAFAGIQIIGQYSDDYRLLEVARMLQEQQGAFTRSRISRVPVVDNKTLGSISKEISQGKRREGEAKGLRISWVLVDPLSGLEKTHSIMRVVQGERSAAERAGIKRLRAQKRGRQFALEQYYGAKIFRTWWQRLGQFMTPRNRQDGPVVRRTMVWIIRKYMSRRGRLDFRITKYKSLKGENRPLRAPRSPKEVDLALDYAFGMWENLKEHPKI